MAKVQLHGVTFTAQPIKKLENGNWRMIARSHGPRWSPGSEIDVAENEVIEMAAAEIPGPSGPDIPIGEAAEPVGASATSDPAAPGLAELDAQMAAERAAIPAVATLLAAGSEIKPDAPDLGVGLKDPFPVPASTRRPSDGAPMTAATDRVRAKLTRVAGISPELNTTIEARADALIARGETIAQHVHDAFGPHEAALDQQEAGLAEVEDGLRLIDNGPLAGSGDGAKQ